MFIEEPDNPLMAIPRHLIRMKGQWVFDAIHLDTSKPVCAMCAGVYKKSWTDRQIELAMKQLEEVEQE